MKLLVPILITPALAACCCLPLRSRRWMEWANLAGFAVTVGLGVLLLGQVLERQVVTECEEFFRADALSAWMVLLISIVSLGSSLYAGQYFSRDLAEGTLTPGRVKEFFILTPAFTTGMLLVVLANNLGVMWFALEATALSSVLLVALYNRRTSLEAAWKYVILGSLGLALALFGTVFIYAAAIVKASPVLPSFNWSHFMSVAPHLDHRMVKVAFVFVLVGYGTKAGLAPMHTWLPDAHSEAPSPTSAMLSGVSLKVALYALLRFHILTTASLESSYSSTLLLVFGLVSMCLAAPFILVQNNLKRLLAYSSLEHVGLICVGFGLNLPVTILGALLHMGYHALAKPVLFFAAGNIHQRCHTLEIRRIGGGLTRLLPWTVVCMAVAAAAATGLPPFGLFYSEMTVLNGGFLGGATWIGVVVVGAILASFCGILCQLSRVLLGGAKAPRTHSSIAPRLFGPQADPAWLDGLPAMGLMLSCLLLFSFWIPGSLFSLLRQAAAIVGGPA